MPRSHIETVNNVHVYAPSSTQLHRTWGTPIRIEEALDHPRGTATSEPEGGQRELHHRRSELLRVQPARLVLFRASFIKFLVMKMVVVGCHGEWWLELQKQIIGGSCQVTFLLQHTSTMTFTPYTIH
jgi:hypothetical protein